MPKVVCDGSTPNWGLSSASCGFPAQDLGQFHGSLMPEGITDDHEDPALF